MDLEPIIDFGRQPHANSFLTKSQIKDEYFYNMVVGFDDKTSAIGLVNTNKREDLFNDHYAFYSKTSEYMKKHFRDTADKLREFVHDGIMVEIGSNDGIMQDAWRDFGIMCIGVEPSKNVARIAEKEGHDVIKEFMGEKVVNALKSEDVALVYAANVTCHTVDLDEYFGSIAKIMKDDGVFVFEDPYFLDVYEKCSYDQFYGEHAWMFTITFIQNVLKKHGLMLFDCEHLWTHGGSMRYYVCKEGMKKITPSVYVWKDRESNLRDKLIHLKQRIKDSRIALKNILESVKDKKICGFGATSKGVVVCNYCDIKSDLIPFITDTTPTKIGKLYPGVHIPIVKQLEDYSEFDYIVNFAWNHFEEIKGLNLGFKGRWITHVPYPHLE